MFLYVFLGIYKYLDSFYLFLNKYLQLFDIKGEIMLNKKSLKFFCKILAPNFWIVFKLGFLGGVKGRFYHLFFSQSL